MSQREVALMRADGTSSARKSHSAFDSIESTPGQDDSLAEISLVVTDGQPLGRRIPLGNVPVVIGRASADLQLEDPTVSRHHCVVWCLSGRCWVRDLGSTNSTRVNDRSALVVELFDGDRLVIGHTVLTVSIVHAATSSIRAR
jgi:pSer/pThr/pTyr-binding forkhead associated (FHA) protein